MNPAQTSLSREEAIAELRTRLSAVLDDIDRLALPGDIGAHVDLAIQRMDRLAHGQTG